MRLAGRLMTKVAETVVTVYEPSLQTVTAATSTSTGPGGCVTGINVNLSMTVLRPSEFVASAVLRASNGMVVTSQVRAALAVGGSRSMAIPFPTETLRLLGVSGPYTITSLNVQELASGDMVLAHKAVNAGTTPPVPLDQLCAAPIEILPGLNASVNTINDYIGSLVLRFSILAQTGGSHSISFKIVGAGGEDLGVFNESRNLSAGVPTEVRFTLPANVFLPANGPYSVISVLVTGSGGTAQASQIGNTATFSKWQFKPRINGDLDDDLDVDAMDQRLQSTFRNQSAASPGDRRDLNRDGRIDILDLRLIQTLACTVGTCPTAP